VISLLNWQIWIKAWWQLFHLSTQSVRVMIHLPAPSVELYSILLPQGDPEPKAYFFICGKIHLQILHSPTQPSVRVLVHAKSLVPVQHLTHDFGLHTSDLFF